METADIILYDSLFTCSLGPRWGRYEFGPNQGPVCGPSYIWFGLTTLRSLPVHRLSVPALPCLWWMLWPALLNTGAISPMWFQVSSLAILSSKSRVPFPKASKRQGRISLTLDLMLHMAFCHNTGHRCQHRQQPQWENRPRHVCQKQTQSVISPWLMMHLRYSS